MFRPKFVPARSIVMLMLFFVMISPFSQAAWAQTPEAPVETQIATDAPTEIPTEVPTEIPTEAPPPPPVETEVPPPPPPPPPVETEVPTVVETEVPPVETATEVVQPVETATEVPVEPVETQVPVGPTETEMPAEPTETEVPAEPTQTQIATESPTTEPTPTVEGTPTPTEEVIEPDQLVVVGNAALTVAPGQFQDVTTRYTLGSDRNKTELTAILVAPGGESLEGWVLSPINRGDALEDPADLNRAYKARVDVTDVTKRQETFDITWRLTAPAHVETPIAIRIDFSATTHRDDGVTDGAAQVNLVSATGTASVHAPTLTCDLAEAANTWNCAVATTHPGNDVVVSAKAVVPEGWDLKVNSAQGLSDIATPLDATVVAAGAFTLSADYPIGCPDKSASSVANLTFDLTYPSGDVATFTQDLALTFDQPSPALEVTSFTFGDVNMIESLTATGTLTLAYSNAPCEWVAAVDIADLHSEAYTVTDAVISITGTEADPGISIVMADGSISIQAPESASDASSGVITIHLQIDLPHQIPPGSYAIGVVTEIKLRDQL